jgi:hypothetical protein
MGMLQNDPTTPLEPLSRNHGVKPSWNNEFILIDPHALIKTRGSFEKRKLGSVSYNRLIIWFNDNIS